MDTAAGPEVRRSLGRRPLAWIGLLGLGLASFAWLGWRHPLGPGLIDVATPAPGHTMANEALEVFVRFPHTERTRPETLRVLLNGADVSGAFDTAENGAIGDVVLLVDGENVLEIGVFGRAWWAPGRLVEHVVQRRFHVERRIDRNWG